MILILDVDDVLLDWADGIDTYIRVHYGYNGIYIPNSSLRLCDLLDSINKPIDDLILEFNTSVGFSRLSHFKDSLCIVDYAHRFSKIIALTSCGDDKTTIQLRRSNLLRLFGDIFHEIIHLPILKEKKEVLDCYKGINDVIMLDDNEADVCYANSIGIIGIQYHSLFHNTINDNIIVNSMSDFLEIIDEENSNIV